jgi:hypothetical protein
LVLTTQLRAAAMLLAATASVVAAGAGAPALAQETEVDGDFPALDPLRLRRRDAAAGEDPFSGEDGPGADNAGTGGLGEDALAPADRDSAGPGQPLRLDDSRQAAERRAQGEGAVTDPDNTDNPDPRANVRAAAIDAGQRRRDKIDPFLPEGFRAGTWTVFTRLEQAIGYATNASFAAGGSPGAFSQTQGSLTARSNWSRHELLLEANGALRQTLDGGSDAIPSASAAASLRLDLIDGLVANLRGGYTYQTESASSPNLSSSVVNRPGVHGLAASGELARSGGKLAFALRGSIDRTLHEDAELSGGGTFSQEDRNNTLLGLSLRAAYAPGGAIDPFLQAGIGRRIHDLQTDRNGDRRDSWIADLRAGLLFDFGEKFAGEASIGWLSERFDDAGLQTLDALSLNAALDWSPVRDSVVRFSASTALSGSTTAGENGYVNYNLGVEAARRVRDNLAVNALARADISLGDASGSRDITWTLGAGVEYWLNRHLSVTADVEHQRLDSSTAGNGFDSTSVRLGLALQR